MLLTADQLHRRSVIMFGKTPQEKKRASLRRVREAVALRKTDNAMKAAEIEDAKGKKK